MGNEINDKKILELRSQIDAKKETLGKKRVRFVPITNCSLEMDGVRVNIQTLTKEQLQMLLIKLNIYHLSATALNMMDVCVLAGYRLNDWMEDVKSRLAMLDVKEEENKLKLMESKLEKMLSDEKKTELELNEIAELLK